MDMEEVKHLQGKKEWKKTQIYYLYELTFCIPLCEICIASWEIDVSGITCTRVHFSDNNTAGMLIATHGPGDLTVSWAQMWCCLHLLLVTAGNLHKLKGLIDYWPIDLHSTLQRSMRADSSSLVQLCCVRCKTLSWKYRNAVWRALV